MSAKPTSRDRSINSGGGHPADPAISECGESERHRLPSDCVNTQRNVLRECIESLQRLTTRDWSRGSQQSVPRDFQQREQIQRKEGRGDSQRLQNDCPGPSEQPVPGDRGSVQLKTSTDGEGIPQESARGEHQQERLVLLSDMNLPTTSTTSMVSTRRRRRGPAPPPLSASLQLSHHLQPPWTDYRNAPAATNTTANTFHSAAAQEEVEDELDIQVRFFTPNDDVFDPDPPPQDSLREITTFPERCSRCLSAGGSELPPVSPGRRSPRTVLLKRNSSSLQPISEQEMLTLMERTDLQEALSVLPPCQCDACQLKEAESLSSSSSSSSLSSLTVAAVAEGEGNCPGGAGVCDQLAGVSSSVPALSPPPAPPTQPTRLRRQSSWKKIRSIIRWSPFIQVFKKHRYPWIQLAGHQGNFQAGEAGSVLKKLDSREHQSFQRLMNDRLQPYVPEFRGVVEKNGERYVQLQDLLCEFSSPCVMDIKMGVRTYLEEELTKARKKPTMRKDMYQKMVDVDSNAPTAEEHAQRAVTKPRYMQWRDQMSSSVDLGFRIEGIKKSDGASSKDFKKTKSRDSVADILKAFIGDDEIVLAKYLKRLREISVTQESSEFFQSHEVVGSSLLFVHDGRGEVNVWMIDFGKTEPLPKGVVINHRATWVEGNHEDGYLFGLDNIISMLEEMQASSMV